jgi:hypothetical protein
MPQMRCPALLILGLLTACSGPVFAQTSHVAGLIAGNGTQSTGPLDFRTFYGSAPNAKLINLRVLDENGAGTDSSALWGQTACGERAITMVSQPSGDRLPYGERARQKRKPPFGVSPAPRDLPCHSNTDNRRPQYA